MALGYLVVAVLAAIVAVFALQNGAPATVTFLAWHLEGVPLAGLILGSLVAGMIIAGVPLGVQRWRARSQVRRLEARVRELDAPRDIRARDVAQDPRTQPAPRSQPEPRTQPDARSQQEPRSQQGP